MRTGWGLSHGQLVWDKTYQSTVRTDSHGEFRVSAPGPTLLTGGGVQLRIEARGYQQLTEVYAEPGAHVLVQTKPAIDGSSVRGGLAQIGILENGQLFGWSFIENRPTTDAAAADVFPSVIERSPLRIVLRSDTPAFSFVAGARQNIAARSYGMYLRYVDAAPPDGYAGEVTLGAAIGGGTLFVRTKADRYAKVAFDPGALMTGQGPAQGVARRVAFSVMLPFAYNPYPGRDLRFDPANPAGIVQPEEAAAAADMPGARTVTARQFRLEVVDEAGALVDSLAVTLDPETPVSVTGRGPYRYEDVRLAYGPHGGPQVSLRISGKSFAYNTAEIVTNRRYPVEREFQDFDAAYRPLARRLRIQEIPR